MNDCIFCKIVAGQIPGNIAYEDERILVFHDLEPQAPVHVLMVPKEHIGGIQDARPEHRDLLGYMMTKVQPVAESLGLSDGYRVVINSGEDGLQTVPHLHLHILGKRKMTWPPG